MNILDQKEFTLDIQEEWDSFEKVWIRFVHKTTIKDSIYYVFEDLNKDQKYLLTTRYYGDEVEDLLEKKSIIVNISKKISETNNDDYPLFFATGRLSVIQ
jgi:hypothetical protein